MANYVRTEVVVSAKWTSGHGQDADARLATANAGTSVRDRGYKGAVADWNGQAQRHNGAGHQICNNTQIETFERHPATGERELCPAERRSRERQRGSHLAAKAARFLLASAVALLLCSLPAFSQTYKGTIRGVVTDTSGAIVPGATVTVTDVQRGTKRTLVTNDAGVYVAPDLVPSTYAIQVSAKGFATVEHGDIELGVAQDLSVNFIIKPGTATQTVVVTGGAPLLNTTNATLGGTLSNQTINNLPLNGRNFLNLLTLRPGVLIYPGGGFQTQSANGLRPTDVSYLLNGLMEYEPFQGQSIVNESNFAGDAATILPIDAIQQFNVVQNPPAQYGWAPGAVANVALKSGTNQIHGTAYAFGREASWDARNFFNTGPQTPLSLEQFGGSAGGPILKNKLFFFATYEGQRYTVGNTFQGQVPVTASIPSGGGVGCAILTTGDCSQSVPDAFADLQAQHPGFAVNSISANLLKLYPANSTNSVNIPISLPNTNTSNDGVFKIDYQLTPHQQLSYDYFIGDQYGTAMTINVLQPQFLSLLTMRVQTNGFHWTWNPNPSWVNDFRAGFDLFHQGLPAIEPADYATPASTYGVPTGVTNPIVGGLPDIFVAGFSMLGGDFVLPKVLGPNYIYEMDDTVSYLHGNHYFTFGTQIQHWIVNAARFANGRGRLKYNHCADGSTPLECFLAGEPFLGILLQGNPLRRVNQWASSFFFQDDWHVRPTLTVNLGLRYNYLTALRDAHGGLASFDPSLGLIQQGVNGIDTVYNADPNDWAPRLGFAWNPGSGRTVVRGGFNIMYSRIDLFSMLSQVGLNNALTTGLAANVTQGLIPNGTVNAGVVSYGNSQLNLSGTGTIFPTGTLTCTADAPCSIMGVVRNLRNPRVMSWSLGLQHAFGQKLSVDASYVGNHGSNMLGILDINQVDPNSPAEIACGHCEQAGRPFNATYPYLAYINMMTNEYRSNYNALQLTVNERGYHGLSFLLGYTWSHALDMASTNISTGPQNSLNPAAEYGNSSFDIPQRFTFSATYAFPNSKSLRPLTNGWNATSIVTLQSGAPWGPVDLGNDPSLTGEFNDRWNIFGDKSAFSNVTASAFPYFPGSGDPNNPTANSACNAHATTLGMQQSLASFGCYAIGNSVMMPAALGTFGTLGRNALGGPTFLNWDASIFKDFHLGERLTAQFRAEFFNLLNHPELVNPSFNGSGFNDPSSPSSFGCGCSTPDVQAQNPVLGSGGPRAIQLGLKLIF